MFSENKDIDQLCCDGTADLCLCFGHINNAGFSLLSSAWCDLCQIHFGKFHDSDKSWFQHAICPCSVGPLKPLSYIVKLG